MLKPEFERVQLGSAEIREIFRSSKFGNTPVPSSAGEIRAAPRRGSRAAVSSSPRTSRSPTYGGSGGCHRGPRGLRVRYQPRVLQTTCSSKTITTYEMREAPGVTPSARPPTAGKSRGQRKSSLPAGLFRYSGHQGLTEDLAVPGARGWRRPPIRRGRPQVEQVLLGDPPLHWDELGHRVGAVGREQQPAVATASPSGRRHRCRDGEKRSAPRTRCARRTWAASSMT